MRAAIFSTQPFEQVALEEFNKTTQHELVYFTEGLSLATISMAAGFDAVCTFVNDHLDDAVLEILEQTGVKLIALRCAGYDSVDLKSAERHHITVARVPSYSPHAVAEYTVGLLLALNRKIPMAWDRVRGGDFDLHGLLGYDLHGKTVGIIGTGKIGAAVARALQLGFGCHVVANDLDPSEDLKAIGVRYVDRDELFRDSDIICLNCPLTRYTRHIINAAALDKMKPGVEIVNTSRGGLIDNHALIDALESGHIGGCALDVYEGEDNLFFRRSSMENIQDTSFKRLVHLPNVLITGHQALLTEEAIDAIAKTTLTNLSNFEDSEGEVVLAVEKYP